MRLISPNPSLYIPFLEMAKDFVRSGDTSFIHDQTFTRVEFEAYIGQLVNGFEDNYFSSNKSSQIRYWYVNETNQIVGIGNLRKKISNQTTIPVGNIGYKVAPTFRKQGHGSQLLSLLLAEAKQIELSRVLLTCYKKNKGSARIIQKNGGVLSKVERVKRKRIQYYWIELKDAQKSVYNNS